MPLTRAKDFVLSASITCQVVHLLRLLPVALGAGTMLTAYTIFRPLLPDRSDRHPLALSGAQLHHGFARQAPVPFSRGSVIGLVFRPDVLGDILIAVVRLLKKNDDRIFAYYGPGLRTISPVRTANAIVLIHAAGGVAVLAHLGTMQRTGR